MINYYKYAKQYVERNLRNAGLQQKQLATADFHFDYWDTMSDKPSIFLLNGFGANAEFQWFKQVKILQEHYRVILVNLLYFGNSKAVNKKCYAINCQVKFIEALREELEIQQLSIAGISYGGLVAIEYTHAFTSRISQLFLIDAAVKYLTTEHLDKVCAQYNAPSIEDFFAPKDDKALKRQLQAAYFRPPYLPAAILKSCHTNMCAPYLADWLQLISALRHSMDELTQRQYHFNTRTHIFWGADDEIIPLTIGEKLSQEFHSAELIVLKNAGHMPNLEQAKQFNKALGAVLKSRQSA